MIAKNKSKFIVAVIAVFLAIVTVGVGIIVNTPRASGATFTDGTGHSYTGNGHNVKGDFNIRYLDTDNEIAGYRFTVLRYDSSVSKYKREGSLDVFKTDTRMPSNSNNAYTSHLKYTVGSATGYNYDKYTLKRYYSSLSITPENYTSSNSYRVYSSSQVVAGKYNYALASDLGVTLPDTTGMEDFSNNEDNIDKILSRLGNDDSGSAYTLNTLLPNPEMFVFVEPLFDIRLGNLGDTSNETHAFSITLSEIALIGRLTIGDDSDGTDGKGDGDGWTTVRRYTNSIFPTSLYTTNKNEHERLGINNGSKLYSNSNNYERETFKTIFEDGYGLLISWNKNVYTIEYELNGGYFDTAQNTLVTNSKGEKYLYNPSYAYYNIKHPGATYMWFYVQNPKRDGYTFNGWKIDEMDGVTHHYWNGTDYSGNARNRSTTAGSLDFTNKTYINCFYNLRETDGPVVFTAQWTKNPSTLVVDPNGGTWNGSTSVQTFTDYFGNTKVIRVPTRSGYTFAGWSKSSNFNGSMSSLTANATYTYGKTAGATDTIKAQWNSTKYNINYNLDGGSFNTDYDTLVNYSNGQTKMTNPTFAYYGSPHEGALGAPNNNGVRNSLMYFQIENPKKTGYIFTGWTIEGLDTAVHTYWNSSFKASVNFTNSGPVNSSQGDSNMVFSTVNNNKILTVKADDDGNAYATNFYNLNNSRGTVTFKANWVVAPSLTIRYAVWYADDLSLNDNYDFELWTDDQGRTRAYICKATPQYNEYGQFITKVITGRATQTLVATTKNRTKLIELAKRYVSEGYGLYNMTTFGLSKKGYVFKTNQYGSLWGGTLDWDGNGNSYARSFGENQTALKWNEAFPASQLEKFYSGKQGTVNMYPQMDGPITSTVWIDPNGGTVKYNYNDSSGVKQTANTTASLSYTRMPGETIYNIERPTRAGYKFIKWNLSDNFHGTLAWGGIGISVGGSSIVNFSNKRMYVFGTTKNAVDRITAQWSPNFGTLIVDPDGGQWYNPDTGTTSSDVQRISKYYDDNSNTDGSGARVNIAVPTMTGYRFLGWQLLSDSSSPYYDFIGTRINKNHTPTGWFESYNGAGVILTAEGTYFYGTADGGVDRATASWTPAKYTATFDLDGGSWPSYNDTYTQTGNRTKQYIIENTLLAANWYDGCTNWPFTKSGYTFAGWKVASTNGNWEVGHVYTDNYLANTTGMYGDVTFKAQWESVNNIRYFWVKPDGQIGGEYTTLSPVTYTTGQTTALPAYIPNPDSHLYLMSDSKWHRNQDCTDSPVTAISETETGDKVFYTQVRYSYLRFTVNVYRDDVLWHMTGNNNIRIVVGKDGVSQEYWLSDDGYGSYDFKQLLYGSSVEVFARLHGNSGEQISLYKKDSVTVTTSYTVKYYTVSLYKGTGIAGVSGAGTYLVGRSADIDAELETGYGFKNWTGTKTYTDKNTTISNIRAPYIETANADPVDYDATFDINGGTWYSGKTDSPRTRTYRINMQLTAAFFAEDYVDGHYVNGIPYREGYTFSGWKVTSCTNGNWTIGTVYEGIGLAGDVGMYGDVAFVAQWTPSTAYTVSFHWRKNGVDMGPISTMETITRTADVATSLGKIPTLKGYTVLNSGTNNWFVSLTGDETANSVPAGTAENKVFYADKTLIDYTATFKLGGGRWASDNTTTDKTVSYTIVDILNAPEQAEPTKSGYTFAGWQVTTSGGDWSSSHAPYPDYTLENKAGLIGNVTFTAQWTPITYTVRFDPNGGTGTMEDQQFTYNEYQNLRPFAFTPATGYHINMTGYVWSRNPYGGVQGGSYKDQQNVKNLTNEPNGIVTLYALWVANKSTLNIDPNGGKWNNKTTVSTYTKNFNTTLDIPVPTREGYVFTGWVKSNPFYGTITSLTKAATYTFCELDGVSSTLTASWQVAPEPQYTATFNPNGGVWTNGSNVNDSRMVNYTASTPITVPGTVYYSGYTFNGWKVHSTVGTWTKDKVYTAAQIESLKNQSGNVVFDAVWEASGPFTIEYRWSDNGELIQKESYSFTPKDLMTVPSCAGYTVVNEGTNTWFTSTSGSTTATRVTTLGNKVFYARRTAITYQINYYYVTPEGNAVKYTDKSPTSYTVTSATINLPSPTVPSGYVSLADSKWHTDAQCASPAVTQIARGSTGNVNLYTKVNKKYDIVYKWTDGTTISGLNPTYYTSGKTTQLATVPAVDGYTVPMQNTNKWLTSPTGTTYVTQVTPSDYGNKVFYADRVKNDVFYTITCDFNGGSGGTPSFVEKYEVGYYKSATATATITSIPSLPKRTGYVFNGYNSKQNGTGDEVVDKNGNILTSNTYYTADTTIYAQWKPIEYDVRFMGNGATSGHMDDQHFVYDVTQPLTQNAYERKFKVTYVYNDGTTANEDVYANATFNGWAKTSTGAVVYSDKQSVGNLTTTNNVIVRIYAKWTDASVVLPNPSKPGYKFDGWYPTDDPNPDPDTKIGGPNDPYTPSSDITVYGHWTPIEYDVKFHANGGTPTNDTTQHFVYDVEQPLTSSPYSKTGYTFTGWNTEPNGSGTPYTDKQVVKNLTTVDGAVIDLYAQWKPIEYDVRYNGNGNTNNVGTPTQHFVYDQGKNMIPNPFVRVFNVTCVYNDGTTSDEVRPATATFNGWAKTANGNVVYSDKQYVKNLTTTNGAIIDVYAKWTDGTIILPNLEKPGYEFDGWFPTNNPNPDPDTKIGDPGDPYTPDEDITIYGHWTPIEYDVKFHANGGTPTDNTTQHFVYDQGQNLTPNPYSKPGYKFDGWNTKPDGTGTPYTDKQYVINLTTVKNDVIDLYAQWKPIEYIIRFDGNGTDVEGNMPDLPMVYDVEKILTPISFTRDGYSYGDPVWNTKPDGTGTSYTNEQAVKNLTTVDGTVITLYAQWEEDALLYLEPVAQNAEYREGTEVMTSFYLVNETSRDRIPTDNVILTFKIYDDQNNLIATVIKNNAIVPKDNRNLYYFKWTVPAGLDGAKVRIVADITERGNTYGEINPEYLTRPHTISNTPEIEYEFVAPSWFQGIPETPDPAESTSASWTEWTYVDGAFVEVTYGVTATASATITPDEDANVWVKDGKTYTRSGYGIEFNATGSVTTMNGVAAATSDMYTAAQGAIAYVPEFLYSDEEGKYVTLENVDGTFKVYEDEDGYRSHFSTLWYPDGEYVVYFEVSDIWTPMGMIKAYCVSNVLMIEGTVYDDWHLG